MLKRQAGILLAVSSLPNKHGVGTFGESAYEFIDLLKKSCNAYWQILPLNPIGYGHSPYQPFSSFAIDEIYIDLDLLTKEGLIDQVPPFHEEYTKSCYEDAREYKIHFLYDAYKNEISKNKNCLNKFISENSWVSNYGVFYTFKTKNQGRAWIEWPDDQKEWINNQIPLKDEDFDMQNFAIWLQMTAYKQWNNLHKYANNNGIKIIGDIPFYVGLDSLDVWDNKIEFLLDEKYNPTFIAGVPPDYFSATGQRWGNPIYNWDHLEKSNFKFLIDRILLNSKIYDVIRLDHFRAFDTYWKVPSSCETAVEGKWIEAPGYKFFDELYKQSKNIEIIAEDLGMLREEVYELKDHYNLPGMNVVEFTFNDTEISKTKDWNIENQITYLGTHDNDTVANFFAELPQNEQEQWINALREKGYIHGSINHKLIQYALNLKSKIVILDMQDILELGPEGRMNVPGVINDINWTWKLQNFNAFKDKLSELTSLIKDSNRE